MSDEMQFSNRQVSEEAKRLESLGQFDEAATLFKQCYDDYPGSFVTSHYIKCLRKQGQSQKAVTFGRQLPRQLQNNPFVHKELSWALYDVYLKKSEKVDEEDEVHEAERARAVELDLPKMQEIGNYILSKASPTDDLLLTRTIFALCNAAKQLGSWHVAYDFAVRLNPERLSTEASEWQGQKIQSDYQRWLNIMVKALFHLKRFEECIAYAQKGIEYYPREKLFLYRKAAAKKALGRVEEALQEFEQIDKRFLKDWYIERDIAEIYMLLQHIDEAKIWFCKAARCPGEMKGRYKMFEQMAALFEQQGTLQGSFNHLQLACAIAEREGWERSAAELRGKLELFKRRYAESNSLEVETSRSDLSRIRRRCEALWQEVLAVTRSFSQGQVVKLNEEKGYGFIRSNDGSGKDIYFKFRNLARGLIPFIGMKVEFEIEESFDSGKNQESQAAINIRCVRGSV